MSKVVEKKIIWWLRWKSMLISLINLLEKDLIFGDNY